MDNNEPIRERLIKLSKELDLSMRNFSASVGKSPGWLQSITKDIGSDILAKILVTYPTVNIRWLLLGEGEMFIKNEENPSNKDYLTQYLEKRVEVLEVENKKQAQQILELNILLAKKETELELMHAHQCEKNEGLSPSLSSLEIGDKNESEIVEK